MIQDKNNQPIPALGAAAPAQTFWAVTGAANVIHLTRGKVYRVQADNDTYMLQSDVAGAAAFAPPDNCEYLIGGTLYHLTTEAYAELAVQAVATPGFVRICEVD